VSEERRIINPFPGLRPFETEEYRLFFGREGQSDALVERLERSRFLAVVGTSGSGKSSLVRAGLLPALRGGMMAGAGAGWRVAVIRPGHDPVGNLAHALAEKDVLSEAGAGLPRAEAEALIEATLRRGSLGLVDAARQARLGDAGKLLVVVDQFEELFRFRAARAALTEGSATDDDAAAFVKLLLEAARQREVPLYVVLTMRSDFLGDCAQFQGLPEAINDGQYLIPRMTRDERRFAITGPVRVARARMSEPLVNRLLNDVGDNPDQLPILQHALMRTWDYWSAHRSGGSEALGIEHYEAVGTMSDALSKHADEAFNELPDERSRHVAEVLFRALTERGADNREIRRPTRLREICEIAGASVEEVSRVVEVFRREGRSFLMPPVGVALEPETVIDISHESLIRNWDRLRAWARDEAEAVRIYRRLASSAADYREGLGGLLDDVTLQYVLRWREKYEPNRAWGMRYNPEFDDSITYLEQSHAARDARISAERERDERELEQARAFAEQQSRAARRMRWLAVGMGVMFFFALAGAGYAYTMGQRAQQSERFATEAKEHAEGLARELSNSLAGENFAKLDAIRHQQDAEVAQRKAEDALGHADAERKKAEAESKRADMEADLAAKHANDERHAKEGLRAALDKSEATKVASQFFRHALTDLDRAGSNEEMSDAYNRLNESIKKFETIGDNDGVAAAYVTLGKLDSQIPEPLEKEARAQKYLPKAVAYYLKDGNHNEAGETLESIADTLSAPHDGRAGTYYKEEFNAEAIQRYEEAYKEFSATSPPNWAGMVSVLKKAAVVHDRFDGEAGKRKAVEKVAEAVALQRAHLPGNAYLPGDLLNLAVLYRQTGPPEKAEAHIDEILASVRATGGAAEEVVFLEQFLGQTKSAAQDLKYIERAKQIYRQLGAESDEAMLLEKMAGALLNEDEKEGDDSGETVVKAPASELVAGKALEYYEVALKYYERQATSANFEKQVELLSKIGDLHKAAGRSQEAIAVYSRAISLGREKQVGTPAQIAFMLRKVVELQMAAGQLRQAHETAIQLLDYLKANLETSEFMPNILRAAEKKFQELEEMIRRQQPSPVTTPTPTPPRQL
jgi:tetratricopeptide (TPR) repeat protein